MTTNANQTVYAGEVLVGSQIFDQVENIVGAGATKVSINPNIGLTLLDTTAAAADLVLGPANKIGTKKTIIHVAGGTNGGVLAETDVALAGTIVSLTTSLGGVISLIYISSGWAILSTNGNVVSA